MVSLTSIVAIEEVANHIIALITQPSLNYSGAILYRLNTIQQNEYAEECLSFTMTCEEHAWYGSGEGAGT